MPPSPPNRRDSPVYTVSQLNREAKRLLESEFPAIWLGGEISGFKRHSSGHLYFRIKDDKAQIDCAMWRGANQRLTFKPADGMQVIVRGRLTIYEVRGNYQFVVEEMEEAGEGLLRRQFEALKRRLDAEGLFAEEHKQPLPRLPGSIGVVTSPTGAAIRDILQILKRRYPAADVVVYPTRVQGESAKDEIAAAIRTAGERDEVDVLIIARGGGSLEDLWAFNEEVVARAIYDCKLPTVAGIGHEVDVTIADLVADLRAPTPSGAAQLVVPDSSELLRATQTLERRAVMSLQRRVDNLAAQQVQLLRRLDRVHPGAVLEQLRQQLDELSEQLADATLGLIRAGSARRANLTRRLRAMLPRTELVRLEERLQALRRRLSGAMNRSTDALQARLGAAAGNLQAVSPLATLERGYAIVRDESGAIVKAADQVRTGQAIEVQLARGSLAATVKRRMQ